MKWKPYPNFAAMSYTCFSCWRTFSRSPSNSNVATLIWLGSNPLNYKKKLLLQINLILQKSKSKYILFLFSFWRGLKHSNSLKIELWNFTWQPKECLVHLFMSSNYNKTMKKHCTSMYALVSTMMTYWYVNTTDNL